MKLIKTILTVVATVSILGATTAAFAGQIVTPTEVGCDLNGECWAVVTPALTGVTCGNTSNLRFRVSGATVDPGAEGQFKTATSALLAGKKLDVQPSGSCTAVGPTASYVGMPQ